MTKLRMKIVPPGRINSLALHMDAEEIARLTEHVQSLMSDKQQMALELAQLKRGQ